MEHFINLEEVLRLHTDFEDLFDHLPKYVVNFMVNHPLSLVLTQSFQQFFIFRQALIFIFQL